MRIEERITEYTLNAVPDGTCSDFYAWEVKVAYRGKGRYAVLHGPWCFDAHGNLDYEPMSLSREDEWLATHRFTEDEALALARKVAPTVTVNGWTPAAVIEKWTGHGSEGGGRD